MAEISEIEQWLGQSLPAGYAAFLSGHRESFLAPNSRTLVYGREDLRERNETFEVREFCPGHLLIGDDSGGTGILMNLSTGTVSTVGLGVMAPSEFIFLVESFEEWLGKEFPFIL